jgi:2,3-bisphosphoglycerate-independent phosphoglycerate mutase
MAERLQILFIFVDGLGMDTDDPSKNPLHDPRFPNLKKLLLNAIPLDACLGVDGLPQSATGQAALLTGINAPKLMGRHIEGFPPPTLKKMIQHENVFSKLRKLGKNCTFANSYWLDDTTKIPSRRQSVTTVMTLAALGKVRSKAELRANQAVNHDITRWTMHTRGYDEGLITPEEAADHLLSIAEEHDFTLFEYFLTDRAGHSGNPERVSQTLETLERFLPRAARFAEQPNHLFLLCSDHGNIEDLSTVSHTRNPVPLVVIGDCGAGLQSCETLADLTPSILRLYGS